MGSGSGGVEGWGHLVEVGEAQLVVLGVELEEERIEALGRVVDRAGVGPAATGSRGRCVVSAVSLSPAGRAHACMQSPGFGVAGRYGWRIFFSRLPGRTTSMYPSGIWPPELP